MPTRVPATAAEVADVLRELRRRHAAGDPSAGIRYFWRQNGRVLNGTWTEEVMQVDLKSALPADQVYLISARPEGPAEVEVIPFPWGHGVEYAEFFLPLPRVARRKRRDSETQRAAALPKAKPANNDDSEEEPARPAPAQPEAARPAKKRKEQVIEDLLGDGGGEDAEAETEISARTFAMDPALWGQLGAREDLELLLPEVLAEIAAQVADVRANRWDAHVVSDVAASLRDGLRSALRFPELSLDPHFLSQHRRLWARLVLFRRRSAGVAPEALAAFGEAIAGSGDPEWLRDADRRAAATLKTRQWSLQSSGFVPRGRGRLGGRGGRGGRAGRGRGSAGNSSN